MKKIFSFFVAALLLSSCSNDDFAPAGVEGQEEEVTISIALPGELQSRATLAGTSAQGGVTNLNGQELTFNVALYYQGDKEEAVATPAWVGTATGAQKVTFKPTLVIGKKYRIVAVAAYNDVTWDPATGAVNANVVAEINNEAKDAYYCDITATAEAFMSATLYRPYGKLRIVTTDWEEALNQFNTDGIKNITVEYTNNVETQFNPLTGEFETAASYSHTANTINEYTENEGEKTLVVDYLPAATEGASLYNFTVTAEFNNGETFSREFNMDVPVKRNYVTTLIGNFFTSTAQLDVEVDDAFNGSNDIDANLFYAFQDGGYFTLPEDVTLSKALTLAEGKTLNLDLGGNTITLSSESASAVVELINNGTLNLSNGKIVTATADELNRRCVYNYGTMTINNVEFVQLCETKGAAINNEGKMTIKDATVDAVYYSIWNSGADAEMTIESGSFTTTNNVEVKNTWSYCVNNLNGAKLTVNGGEFEGNHGVIASQNTNSLATLNAGTFYCNAGYTGNSDWTLYAADNGTIIYNPETCSVTSENPSGTQATSSNGVIAKMVSAADLATLVAVDGATVYVPAGEYTLPTTFGSNVTVICANGAVFTGQSNPNINGATIIGATFSNEGGSALRGTVNATFKDCTFEGGNASRYLYAGETAIFENCVFAGTTYGVHFDGGANDVVLKGCTISGFNAFGQALTGLTIEDCTFEQGTSNYNHINLWGSATMTNSTLNGTTICPVMDGKTYIFNGCKNENNENIYSAFCVYNTEDLANKPNAEITVDGNTCVVVGSDVEFKDVLARNKANIVVQEGEYSFATNQGITSSEGTVTFTGLGNGSVISFSSEAGWSSNGGLNAYANDMDLVFKNLKMVSPVTGSSYTGGFGHAKTVKFENCTYEGQFRASSAVTTFNNCTIDPQTSYIYTDYADANFNSCEFNCSEGKGIQVYNDGATTNTIVTVKDCTFTAAKVGNTWDGKPVSAIDINSNGEVFTVNISNTTATGFGSGEYSNSTLWNIKGGAEYITVSVDGTQVD